ncbi:RlpA-like double-psi beta-barrel-protein domain-containing protein-containing protein [Mycena belliarum]|uniref:RlpA-like double-psi beta-barrel-protein domain-containing protein-containing protein n=1 Tax=Mycena belliarum TaxID=1033014 RepID=A0AAD6TTF2_9AGAR|nr:RlpA-like double-psi beta-barrel-protein domain-containing protein-containing protein [Mycena belliae]
MKLTGTSFIAALASGASGAILPRTTGPATWYSPNGGFGACGQPIQNGDFAVALSSANYADNGKSINAVVRDLCPGCASNGIDLTQGAFSALANLDLGVIQVVWNFV